MEAQSMNLLKKNALSVIGWLVFAGFYKLFIFFLSFWTTNSRFDLASFQWSPFLYIALIYAVSFIVGFLAYVLSWRLVVFPISRRGGLMNVSLKHPLILEWLAFCLFFFWYCLPIGLIKAFPGLLPISKNTANIIISAWQAMVSLWLYRETVLSYLSESSHPLKNAESQSAVPS